MAQDDRDKPRGSLRGAIGDVARAIARRESARKPSARRTAPLLVPLPDDPIVGQHVSPQPAGFGALMPPESMAASPASLLDTQRDYRDDGRLPAAEGVPTQTRAATPSPRRAAAPPKPAPPPVAPAASWLGGRTSDASLKAVRDTVANPELSTTMSQRVAAEEAGRAAIAGDRLSLRLALADLVEKMDLSSPTDSAVLMPDAVAQQLSGGGMNWLQRGKMTVDMTQGGRLFNQLAPVMKAVAKVDIQGELDQAMGSMSERFAKGAKGAVDVVIPEPSGPDSAPLAIKEVAANPADQAAAIEPGTTRGKNRLEMQEVAGGPQIENARLDPEKKRPLPIREVPSAEGAGSEPLELEPGQRRKLHVSESAPAMPAESVIEPGGGSRTDRLKMQELTDANPRVAGKLTLQEVVAGNPEISEVRVVQPPTPPAPGKAQTLAAPLRMSRDALLARFGLGG